MSATPAPSKLRNTPAQTRLLASWEKRLAALAQLARKPALATLRIIGRKADGSIIFKATPGWEIGRTHAGTFIPGPARSFTYRLHPTGRLCGHGYSDCGCGHGSQETSTAQAAWSAGGKDAWSGKLKPAQREARGLKGSKPAQGKRTPTAKTTTTTRKATRAAKATPAQREAA